MGGFNPISSIVNMGKQALGMNPDGHTGDAPNQGGLAESQGLALDMSRQAAADYGAQNQNRADFANQLADKAMGKGPSIAQAQLQQAQDRTLAQQVAAAKANRAVNPALAARQAAMAGAQMQQATAQQSAIARMQEQQQQQGAYQNYLNSLQNARSAGVGAATGSGSALAANIAQHDKSQKDMYGNLMNTGANLAMMAMNKGGVVPGAQKKSEGGLVEDSMQGIAQAYADGGVVEVDASSSAPHDFNYYANMFKPSSDTGPDTSKAGGQIGSIIKKMSAPTGGGTAVGGPMGGAMANPGLSTGAVVPGKAEVKGDSPTNDTVPAVLSPGEMVIPRSVVAAGAKEIHNFAAELLKRQQADKKAESSSLGAALAAKAHANSKSQAEKKKER